MRKVLNRKTTFLLLVIFTVFFIAWTLFEIPMPSTVTKIKRARNVMNVSSNITHSNDTIGYLGRDMLALEEIEQVAVNREIPDTRSESCKMKVYSLEEDLKASIIVTFHNEARSALLRTITSVLNRSPHDLLEEIILIDDYSTIDIEADFLRSYHTKIKVFRNSKREGLIRSRNIGAKFATGHFIVFLDSHCEVNVGWLEPLIYRADEFHGAVVSPILDIIDRKSLQYRTGSTRLKGGFDWSLQFKLIPLSEEELEGRNYQENLSYGSPVTPGGLFLMNRNWFIQLGGFDSNFEIYGGESLELSLKTWMCGGHIEISVCSRVGHVFRRKHSFDFPNGIRNTILHNTKRIAESWLDAQLIEIDTRSVKKANRLFQELKIPNDQHLAFVVLSICHRGTQSQIWNFSVEIEELTN